MVLLLAFNEAPRAGKVWRVTLIKDGGWGSRTGLQVKRFFPHFSLVIKKGLDDKNANNSAAATIKAAPLFCFVFFKSCKQHRLFESNFTL